MPTKLSFNFPLATLLQGGDAICDAAEAHAATLGARLPANYVAETRSLLATVASEDAAQKAAGGDVGTLTREQNARLHAVQDLLGNVRDTAKRAFKGQNVKLRDEFQVGINKPADLAAVLQRARIVLASCQNADNAAALQTKGWLAADTQALSDAITALDQTDDTQETAKTGKKGATQDRNAQANELYERLLTIQNAANLQWPAREGANTAVRAEFRLGTFPPKQETKKKPVQPTPQPPVQ